MDYPERFIHSFYRLRLGVEHCVSKHFPNSNTTTKERNTMRKFRTLSTLVIINQKGSQEAFNQAKCPYI